MKQANEVHFQAIPVSPSEAKTPLQIICFFDQSKNQNYAGGTEAVDLHFEGIIKTLRAENYFHGDLLETLLLIPNKKIPAEKLLLIGLGDPNQFTKERLQAVGKVAINEALKLSVESFCFAPSIKDAGILAVPPDDIAVSLATGMFSALKTVQFLAAKDLVPKLQLKEIFFLASPSNISNAQAGLNKAIEMSQ